MSGGNPGRFDGGPSGETSPDECNSLSVETPLNSPVAQVTRNLRRGDVLRVELEVSAAQIRTLVAKDSAGRVAGSLTPPSLMRIVACIEGGTNYDAVVLDTMGGLLPVRIQARR